MYFNKRLKYEESIFFYDFTVKNKLRSIKHYRLFGWNIIIVVIIIAIQIFDAADEDEDEDKQDTVTDKRTGF